MKFLLNTLISIYFKKFWVSFVNFSDKESKALMSMPSNDVLKVLDDAKTSQNFVVGVDSSQSVQDPFGFNYNNDQTEESLR